MGKNILILLIALLLCNCAGKNEKVSTPDYTSATTFKQDSLAFQLAMIYGLDQGIRTAPEFKNQVKLIQSIDTFNFNRIKLFIEQNGMLSEELLGKENFKMEAVQSAFTAVLLHNPHRLVNEEENMQFFLKLVKDGKLKEKTFLSILDKYYWTKNKDRHVLYGSAFGMPCINDKEKTNKARKKLGFEPLADSLFITCEK
ncbi:hypothetical protein BZG02_14225 [Labilibaculum filiforme]|uniref:Lipoprotein n=1 Tax=Labilibaculum filiforme TaxID=1940526 RepID=A0A2N3HVM6_9BACT|nr:hypothetical protein [Labilibaculum filiforme]PKQ62083.1 hypothetical protein BZG02_14225 [Labilibaculum filiforme]